MQKRTVAKGFSLIELLFAGALFVVFAWGVVDVLLSSLEADRFGTETTIATEYATEGIEAVRSLTAKNFDTLEAMNETGIVSNNNEWEFSGTENMLEKYKRVITITEVKRNGDGAIAEDGGSVDSDSWKVTVTVSWNVVAERESSVSLDTYLTRYK